MLSNLSNIPPWPGIILEKSFILKYLLIAEKTKSPICPTTDNPHVTNINKTSEQDELITVKYEWKKILTEKDFEDKINKVIGNIIEGEYWLWLVKRI